MESLVLMLLLLVVGFTLLQKKEKLVGTDPPIGDVFDIFDTLNPGSGETQSPGSGETQSPGSGETREPTILYCDRYTININSSTYDHESRSFRVSVNPVNVDGCTEGFPDVDVCNHYEKQCGLGGVKKGVFDREASECIIEDCDPCRPVYRKSATSNLLEEVPNIYANETGSCPKTGVNQDEACGVHFEDCLNGSRRSGVHIDGACVFDCGYCPDAFSRNGFVIETVGGGGCIIESGVNSDHLYQTKELACNTWTDSQCYVGGNLQTRVAVYNPETDACELTCNKCAKVGSRTCYDHDPASGEYSLVTYGLDESECRWIDESGREMDSARCKTASDIRSGNAELCPNPGYTLKLETENYDIQTSTYRVGMSTVFGASRELNADSTGYVCKRGGGGGSAAEVCGGYTRECFGPQGELDVRSGIWDGDGSCEIPDCYKEYSEECSPGMESYTTPCTVTCGGGSRYRVSCVDDSERTPETCNTHDCPPGCTGAQEFADVDSSQSVCSKYCGGTGVTTRSNCLTPGVGGLETACGMLECPAGCDGGDREFSEWSDPPASHYGAYTVSRVNCGTGYVETQWRFQPGWRPVSLTMQSDHQFTIRLYFPNVISPGTYTGIDDIRALESAELEKFLDTPVGLSFMYSIPQEGSVPWQSPFYTGNVKLRDFTVQYDDNGAAYVEFSSQDLSGFDFFRNVHDNYTYRVRASANGLDTYSNELVMHISALQTRDCMGTWTTCVNGYRRFDITQERFPGDNTNFSYIGSTRPAFSLGGACDYRQNALSSSGCNTGSVEIVDNLLSNTPYGIRMVNFGEVFDKLPIQYAAHKSQMDSTWSRNVSSLTIAEVRAESRGVFVSPFAGGPGGRNELHKTLAEVSSSITFRPVDSEPGFYFLYIRESNEYLRLDGVNRFTTTILKRVQFLVPTVDIVHSFRDLYKFQVSRRAHVTNAGVLTTVFVLTTKTHPHMAVSFLYDTHNRFLSAVENTDLALMFELVELEGFDGGRVSSLELSEETFPCVMSTWSSWGACTFPGGRTCGSDGYQSRYRTRIQGECTADDNIEDRRACEVNCPVDCVVETRVTPCSKSCAGGKARSEDVIVTQSMYGGRACPQLVNREVDCNEDVQCCDAATQGSPAGGCSIPCLIPGEDSTGIQEYRCTNTDGISTESNPGVTCSGDGSCSSVGISIVPDNGDWDPEYKFRLRESGSGRFLTVLSGGKLALYKKFRTTRNQMWAIVEFDVGTSTFGLQNYAFPEYRTNSKWKIDEESREIILASSSGTCLYEPANHASLSVGGNAERCLSFLAEDLQGYHDIDMSIALPFKPAQLDPKIIDHLSKFCFFLRFNTGGDEYTYIYLTALDGLAVGAERLAYGFANDSNDWPQRWQLCLNSDLESRGVFLLKHVLSGRFLAHNDDSEMTMVSAMSDKCEWFYSGLPMTSRGTNRSADIHSYITCRGNLVNNATGDCFSLPSTHWAKNVSKRPLCLENSIDLEFYTSRSSDWEAPDWTIDGSFYLDYNCRSLGRYAGMKFRSSSEPGWNLIESNKGGCVSFDKEMYIFSGEGPSHEVSLQPCDPDDINQQWKTNSQRIATYSRRSGNNCLRTTDSDTGLLVARCSDSFETCKFEPN